MMTTVSTLANCWTQLTLIELPLTVDEALEQPLYPVTTSRIITDAQGGQHETKGTVSCVYCPNRILKNDNMVQLHLKSTVSVSASNTPVLITP